MAMELKQIRKQLKTHLSKKRYEHTIGVMYTACSLAMCHGIDIQKAQYAALLHDCAKYLDDSEKMKACKKFKIQVTPYENENKELLHAKIGAAFAKHYYEIDDEDILNAIACHTTGKPDMTVLEEIIFIADYIEPNRKELPGLSKIRYLAFHDLTKCIVQIMENTLQYLKTKKDAVDETSIATYEFYKRKQEMNNE